MTAKRPWYKRYPADFRAATASLPYGVKGTYSHVLDLIYDHGGPLDDKTSDIARALGCDRHTWRDHRAALIKAGKLFVEGGKLMNGRAARELGKIPQTADEQMGKSPDSDDADSIEVFEPSKSLSPGSAKRKVESGKITPINSKFPNDFSCARAPVQRPEEEAKASSGPLTPKLAKRKPRSLAPNGARAVGYSKITAEEARRLIREHNDAQAKKRESRSRE